MFGTSLPSRNIPEPMPVPNVSMMTTPVRLASGAVAHLGETGGVGVVDDVDGAAGGGGEHGVDVGADPRRDRCSRRCGRPRCGPPPGTRRRPCHASRSARRARCTTFAIASGVAGLGVAILYRSAVSVPVSRSTGAAFMPVPPMSMPKSLGLAAPLLRCRHAGAGYGAAAAAPRRSPPPRRRRRPGRSSEANPPVGRQRRQQRPRRHRLGPVAAADEHHRGDAGRAAA